MKRIPRYNHQGFTLIEIIISIALIGIISIALLSGIQFALKTLFASGNYMEANYLRQEDLEKYITSGIYTDVLTDNITYNETVNQVINFTWDIADIPTFSVTGDILTIRYDKDLYDDTIGIFSPSSININP